MPRDPLERGFRMEISPRTHPGGVTSCPGLPGTEASWDLQC